VVAGSASALVGGHWDISWHQSIGRDTFWTPPHLLIYLCGILAGISSAYLILGTTFGGHAGARAASVRLWGFRGPLGAFLCAWGGIAMLVSAPFDDWWHNAYGLDVKILSPPHLVLGIGIFAVRLGALVLILGQMNRASGELAHSLRRLFLFVGSLFIVGLLVLLMEHTVRVYMHSARFYLLLAIPVPFVLAGISRAGAGGHPSRWPATTMAAVYTAVVAFLVWILPLFPAEPKLGPVYQKVTHFIPPEFPILLLVPALALDLLRPRLAAWGLWRHAAAAGVVFVASLAAAQWPFASFLMSPAARNRFFGAGYLGFFIEPSSPYALHQFVTLDPSPAAFWQAMAVAVGAAILSTRLGLAWGDWMRRLRR